jgi:hypothetical protein
MGGRAPRGMKKSAWTLNHQWAIYFQRRISPCPEPPLIDGREVLQALGEAAQKPWFYLPGKTAPDNFAFHPARFSRFCQKCSKMFNFSSPGIKERRAGK